MAPVKIFIDSASRVDGTHSNFSFQLPRPLDIQKQYRAMVDQVHIPHTFPTITANNRAIYVDEDYEDVSNPPDRILRQRKVLLAEGQYSGDQLATQIQTKLQTGTYIPGGTYTVSFDADQGKFSFAIAGGAAVVRLLPMGYLLDNPAYFTGFSGEGVVDYDDAGSVIGLFGKVRKAFAHTDTTAMVLGHISVLSHHVLYLHCDQGLGTGEDAIGPRGNGSILRAIPVTTSYGQMLHDLSLNPHDYTTIHKGQMQTFKFRLCDKHGRVVELDQPFSFSILLTTVDDF